MEHQDWEQIKWTKPKTESKPPSHNKNKFNALDGEDPPPPKKITLQLRQKIIQARQLKKMTQKELAQAMNLTQNVINCFENGKDVPTNQQIQKMSKILNVKLK